MKTALALALALTASAALAADLTPHGASAVISAITCKTIDLEPNDGVAAYARLVPTRTDYGPFSVIGEMASSSSGQKLEKARKGAGLESLYLTLEGEGSSGTAVLAPSGNGTVGLLSASSATAPGRVFDTYAFVAAYYPQFRIGPNSAVKCQARYVITAWAKQATDALDSATASAHIASFVLSTGEEGKIRRISAYGNPARGSRYAQESGQLPLDLYNYSGRERIVVGAFQATIDGGRP